MSNEPIRAADGTDITEGVQILYDIAHSSMDWGSGFLDNDEMESVIRLAILMGWKVPDLPQNSDAVGTVALKFPDHYEVEAKEYPARQSVYGKTVYPGYTAYRIKTKADVSPTDPKAPH